MDQVGKNTKNELKIIVVGNSGTGKTSFVNKWIKDTFEEVYKATVVSEFSYKMVDYKEKSYKIQLWDLAGMDQNICITKIFSKDSHGCIVVSDITNEKTLTECVKWKNTVDETTKFLDGTNIPSILVWQFSLAIIYPDASKFIILAKFWFSGILPTATNNPSIFIVLTLPSLLVTSILSNISLLFNLVTVLL